MIIKKHRGKSVSFYITPHTVKQLKYLCKVWDASNSGALEKSVDEVFNRLKKEKESISE
jgi:hypothetical protein